ncbi:MAG: tetratricopeptide repeat protein, partial [Myxococcota bacterium]
NTDTPPPPIDRAEPLFAQCRTELVKEFMRVIAPYKENVLVVLATDGDLPQLEQGNNFAKIGNWGKARGLYDQALAATANNPDYDAEQRSKALFNLGIAHGYAGEYDRGISLLEDAYALNPDGETQRQIGLIRRFKKDDLELAEQKKGNYDAGL